VWCIIIGGGIKSKKITWLNLRRGLGCGDGRHTHNLSGKHTHNF
jgi:hypothetical protein